MNNTLFVSSILIIDDQEITNFINRKILINAGFEGEIHEFTNPHAALDYLKENNPSLILLDLNMPELSGIDFLTSMQNLNLTTKTLILSSSNRQSDKDICLKFKNVFDYFIKPLNKQNLNQLFYHLKTSE